MRTAFIRLILIATLLSVPGCTAGGPPDGLTNGDFAQLDNGRPVGWAISDAAAAKGQATVEAGMLVLRPNAANTPSDTPLGLGQAIDATAFHGRRLSLTARLSGTEGAVAVVGAAALDANGAVERFVSILAGAGEDGVQTATDGQPLGDTARTIIVFASAEGVAGTARIGDIVLDGVAVAARGGPADTVTRFTLTADGQGRVIPAGILGTNVEWIRGANGLWNPAQSGLDPDILGMSAQGGVRLVRFPGGVWSDTYDWRDGTGPQQSRPTTRHIPDQEETSRHSVGTPEIVDFARRLDATLMITVNAGNGTPEQAGAWAAHIRDTHGASVVSVWEIGNELYMENDMSGGSMTPAQYVRTLRDFAAAIRAELPDARIAAIGLVNYGPYRFNAHADWNRIVLEGAGDVIDVFAVHNAYAPLVVETSTRRWTEVYDAMLAAPEAIARNLGDTAALIDASVPAGRGGRIGISVSEWGPSFSYDPTNPYFDHVKTLGSAVFVARTLNVFMREPRVESAAFFKLSDWLNSGWIGPTAQGGWRETPALMAFSLYRDAPGATVLPLTRQSGATFASSQLGFQGGVSAAPVVDALAYRGQAARITVIVSNADLDEAQQATFQLTGGASAYDISATSLSGPAAVAHRGTQGIDVPGIAFAGPGDFEPGGWFARSAPDSVSLGQGRAEWSAGVLSVEVPPAGVVAVTMVPR